MLNRLQQQLECIYEVETSLCVSNFVVTDPDFIRHYDEEHNLRPCREKLLIRQAGDDLDVALYLEKDILNILEKDNPLDCLHDGNIHEFLVALEGISHFIYLAWNAHHDRRISLFELELQAEVDKYIVAVLLISLQQDQKFPRQLLTRLFARPGYAEELSPVERLRYKRANAYAYDYCRALQKHCIESKKRSLLNDARRFYRLTSHHKINHIEQSLPCYFNS